MPERLGQNCSHPQPVGTTAAPVVLQSVLDDPAEINWRIPLDGRRRSSQMSGFPCGSATRPWSTTPAPVHFATHTWMGVSKIRTPRTKVQTPTKIRTAEKIRTPLSVKPTAQHGSTDLRVEAKQRAPKAT